MRLALLTAGALRFAYCDVFLEGLARGALLRGEGIAATLVALVEQGRLTDREYEQLAGYLLAERAGLVGRIYVGRPDRVSRLKDLARRAGMADQGRQAASDVVIDLHAVMSESQSLLGRAA